ncbi:chromosomal replication initiator protein DnaA [Sulfurospirillum barnesii]|uniref:Chromosomal replication initiator protein DnaA n=1 Tax=Sulfurospirillum barnesii (strain ATCC 700032 / DSM 10660 / SES-3) TaxID=760154 RepID=I3XTR3_SULBS|nr:chromosomal replication initiator protein DnaA [Sulfurospirillum barnesii]AFL67337.1 chromosomal replication initiator protein DnaA [Sulfurospirillum barnesii SES-3]
MLADTVIELLKEEISSLEYDRYIKQLKFNEKTSNSDQMIFIAPNILIANWVKTKYADKMAHLFELKTGKKPEVKIILKEHLKSTKSKTNVSTEILESIKSTKNTILNPSYTFNSFVVGSSNQYAYTAAKSVAEKPGVMYNPVFIYGPTGLGKTHLIHAIGNHVQSKGKIVIYATIEQFMNDFTYNLRNQSMERFREKYRSCDVLLIDDTQFLSNKIQTQEEFFHTFNELHSAGKQIVLTSDKPPKMINGLEERLKSRFEWGLIADVGLPELETKIAIIKKKCELDGINLNSDIVNYIASNMGDNIREIESAIINLNAYALLMRQEITLDFAKNVMREQIKERRENISLEDIIQIIAKDLNIKPSEIKSTKRSKNIVEARRIGIYLARTLTPNSMPSLASYFGMKDHTAVSHNIKKINELIETNESFKLKVEDLKNKILTKEK